MYVLVHSYFDKSAFHICGCTEKLVVATTWYNSGDENDVYETVVDEVKEWCTGYKSWRQNERST